MLIKVGVIISTGAAFMSWVCHEFFYDGGQVVNSAFQCVSDNCPLCSCEVSTFYIRMMLLNVDESLK